MSSKIKISEQNIRKIRREIEEEISYNQKLITQREETIQRLRTGKHPFPVGQKIDNTKKEIFTIQEKIETLIKKLNDLNLDDIKEEIVKNMETIQSKSESTKKRKKEQQNTTTRTKTKIHSRDGYRQENDKQICYEYDRYMNICNSIPDYIIEKLNNMENNMGYIWKDIWCFGIKPIRNLRNTDNITLFEKNNGIQYVHFYDKTTYKLFEKDNRGNKKLIISKPRKII